jgi:hypothetical protein
MDFITNLPSSSNKTVIGAVVAWWIASPSIAHFIALPTHITAASLASVFLYMAHQKRL